MKQLTEQASENKTETEGEFLDLLAADMDRRFVFYPILPTTSTEQEEPKCP